MLKKLSQILPRHNSTTKVDPLPDEQAELLQLFNQNMDILKSINIKDEQIILFNGLISQFKVTFSNVTSNISKHPDVKKSIDQYCEVCSDLASTIILDSKKLVEFSDSLIFIYRLYSNLPKSDKFISFFYDLIQESKKNPEILSQTFEILTILFSSKKFYQRFLEIDGYTLVFTSFYMKCVTETTQEQFNHLLFENIPNKLTNIGSQQAMLELFVNTLQTSGLKPPVATFICNFLAYFHKYDSNIYTKFDDLQGFLHLNNFLILKCQGIASNCFQRMLVDSDSGQSVISALYILYTRDETTPELRTSIINVLYSLLSSETFSFEKMNDYVPINNWILQPPQLSKEGLIVIAILLKELSRNQKFAIKSALDVILKIISPPANENEVPVDNFLELIDNALVHDELQAEDLLINKFLEDFILLPLEEDIAKYFEEHVLFRMIVIAVYSAECASEFRFPVLQKFILTSNYIKKSKDFIDFLETLFSKHFSLQIVSLLLSFMENMELMAMFERELRKRKESMNYFHQCNGFLSFDDFVKENPDKCEVVIKIMAGLSYFEPHAEINDWIINQPNDSPIFRLDKEFLAKAAFAFRNDTSLLLIPAFYAFLDSKFDMSIHLNLYLAGKYGIPVYKKLHQKKNEKFEYKDIPNIKQISDRYTWPIDVPSILELDNVSDFISPNMPHYSFYEFIPENSEKSYIKLSHYCFISIFFCIPRFSPGRIQIFHNKSFSIYIEGDAMSITSKNNQNSYEGNITANSWHHIIFNFQTIKKKIDIEMNGNRLTSVDLISDEPNIIIGDNETQLENGFLIAKKILVSNKFIQKTETVWKILPIHSYRGLQEAFIDTLESVLTVHYQGFASYFSSFLECECIFIKFENETDLNKLHDLFELLLKIQKANSLQISRFCDRLFLSIKRQSKVIQNYLCDFLYHLPISYYRYNIEQKWLYFYTMLCDIELLFVFPEDQVLSLLNLIIGELTLDFALNQHKESHLLKMIVNVMRSGISENIVINGLIPILYTLLSLNPNPRNYKYLLNASIAACDWNQNMSYSLPDYPISQLLEQELIATEVSNSLLKTFMTLANRFEEELYDYKQLLDFMILFGDERSFHFGELILIYYLRNPKYLKENVFASFVFSYFCDKRDFWLLAFSILSKNNLLDTLHNIYLSIETPMFLPVIIEMLSALCAKVTSENMNSMNKNNFELLNNTDKNEISPRTSLLMEIFDTIQAFNNESLSYFLQNNCQIPLSILSNLGMVPTTISPKCDKTDNDFLNFSPKSLSKDEFKSIKDMYENIKPFSKLIINHQTIVNAQTSPRFFNSQINSQFDLKSIEPLKNMPFTTSMLSLFSSILFCAAPSNFATHLKEIIQGHSLMNDTYSRFFGQELIFSILIKITISDVPLDLYHKPLFRIIAKYVKDSFFDEKITHLLALLFNLLKSLQLKELFEDILKDQSVLTAYREIIMGAFIYLSKEALDQKAKEEKHKNHKIFKEKVKKDENDNSNNKNELENPEEANIISENDGNADIEVTDKQKTQNNEFSNENEIITEIIKENGNEVNAIVENETGEKIEINENDIIENNEKKENLKDVLRLFLTYKSVVFYAPLFDNQEFSMFWLHITKINKLDTPEVVQCMELFLEIVGKNILNKDEYKTYEKDSQWNQTLSKFGKKSRDEQNEMIFREKKGKSIQNYIQQKINIATDELLFISLMRVINLYIQSNSQIFSMNVKLRQYEITYNKIMQITRTYSLQKRYTPKSFRLSSNPLPMYMSRCVSPSPFEIHSPNFHSKINLEYFMTKKSVSQPRIEQFKQKGILRCSPEWFYSNMSFINQCQKSQINLHEKSRNENYSLNENKKADEIDIEREFYSPFEYSYFLEQKPNLLLQSLIRNFSAYGSFNTIFNIKFFYYIHSIPSVLLISEKALIIFVLAEYNNEDNEFTLIEQPTHPIAFLPFTESITLFEYHHTSLFCGHALIIIDFNRIVKTQSHLFLHKKVGMRITSIFDPPSILIFNSVNEYDLCDKAINKLISSRSFINQMPLNSLIFNLSSPQQATELWNKGDLSNILYLLSLNNFAGRCFSDLTQYPIFPWIASPLNLTPRDLSLPMGQLGKERASHFETTYELSAPNNYYYGFHYSLPGIVFWLLMRLPPFTYFQWDLNNGWDDSQRLFASIVDAYSSASKQNPSDLKELIPEMYFVPEAYINKSNLKFASTINEHVVLPEWCSNSPQTFVDVMRSCLEKCEKLSDWIDLIFGYKQTGEAALQAKNLFLPTSYHSSTAENLQMEEPVFEAQVINFGQCPIQLFYKPHQSRKTKPKGLIKQTSPENDDAIIGSIFSNRNLSSNSHSTSSLPTISNIFTSNLSLNSNLTRSKNFSSLLNKLVDFELTVKPIPAITNLLYFSSISDKNIALNESGAFIIPSISCAIPPRYYHYISIDSLHELLTINSTISNSSSISNSASNSSTNYSLSEKIVKNNVYSYLNPIMAFATNVSVGHFGLFCVISFSSGYAKVYRILYQNKKPTSLEQVGSFSFNESCKCSSLFTEDFICVSVYFNKLIFWNYSTSLLHRFIDLDYQPNGVICDDAAGIVTVFGDYVIEQFTINGEKLRSFSTNVEIKAISLLPLNSSFDGRIIVVGDKNGYVSLLSVMEEEQINDKLNSEDIENLTSEHSLSRFNSMSKEVNNPDPDKPLKSVKNLKLIQIYSRIVHNHPIASLFVLPNKNKIITCDSRGNKVILKLSISSNISLAANEETCHCAFCENTAVTKCSQCGIPLCQSCIIFEQENSALCQFCSTSFENQEIYQNDNQDHMDIQSKEGENKLEAINEIQNENENERNEGNDNFDIDSDEIHGRLRRISSIFD
ncbi:hypothetical protein TRFO_40630 [Tritrichomonas foetus]|uniref:BEACH domain-containing protein n=1 Tax=Tritrichomonas foetus TaxID=1144522 RepID=A0A1J4J2S5_9EUKA|nr:hypothetical protein TRFO_40630 [Tritrichomonas foetus]|eukprot:OHS93041.1 hypothetical protein TRFO_40630 [Tritrichomonas foetus]